MLSPLSSTCRAPPHALIEPMYVLPVLEYMPGGQVEWTKDNQPTMTVDESRSVFRDVVLGLEYCELLKTTVPRA